MLEAWVLLIISESGFHLGLEVSQVTLGGAVVRLGPIGRELRDGDGRQDADDRHDYQQLDEGETFSVSELVQHGLSPFRGIVP